MLSLLKEENMLWTLLESVMLDHDRYGYWKCMFRYTCMCFLVFYVCPKTYSLIRNPEKHVLDENSSIDDSIDDFYPYDNASNKQSAKIAVCSLLFFGAILYTTFPKCDSAVIAYLVLFTAYGYAVLRNICDPFYATRNSNAVRRSVRRLVAWQRKSQRSKKFESCFQKRVDHSNSQGEFQDF